MIYIYVWYIMIFFSFYSDHGIVSAWIGSIHFSSRCNILFYPRHQYSSCRRDDFMLGRPFGHLQMAAMEKLCVSYIFVISVGIWFDDLSARYNQDLWEITNFSILFSVLSQFLTISETPVSTSNATRFLMKQLINAILLYLVISLFAFVFDSWISVLNIMNYFS